jgi:hypothetical protein
MAGLTNGKAAPTISIDRPHTLAETCRWQAVQTTAVMLTAGAAIVTAYNEVANGAGQCNACG